jgi:MoaA/NifB/PqqE/SkfB family radical SAM enzyme
MENSVKESLSSESARYRRSYRLPSSLYCDYPPFPSGMMVEVTNACNHKCFFCANTQMNRDKTFLSLSLYERLIREAGSLGVKELTLYSTGEPLLHKDFVTFIALAKEVGIKIVTTTTNGVFLKDSLARACITAGIDSFRISINAGDSLSYQQVHGYDHFERVISNVEAASRIRKELGSSVLLRVSCVVTKVNEATVEALGNRLKDIVDEVVFFPVGPQSGLMRDISTSQRPDHFIERHPETIYVLSEDYIPCSYPFNRIHLTAEGFLTLCAVDFDGILKCADVNNSTLLDSWHSNQFVEMRRKHLENRLSGLQCYQCVYGAKTEISEKTL